MLEGKLQLAVRPFGSLPLQGVMDGVCRKHLELQQGLREEVTRLLRTRKLRYGDGCLVVVNDEIKKAATNASGQTRAKAGEGSGRAYQRPEGGVKDPGRKGGKFYRTASGKIRYGTKPMEGAEEAKPEEVAAHLVHFRPIPFLSNTKEHRDLIDSIVKLKSGGFNEQDKELIDWWGTAEKSFMKVYKLNADDMQGALGESSYQEQVHDFFLDQDWGDTSKEEVAEALEGCFERYKKALSDPAVQKYTEALALDAEKRVYGWFHKAEAQSEHYDKLTAMMLNNQPEQAAPHLITALGSLQLIFKPDASQRAGEYKGVLAPNNGWLSEDKDDEGYLLTLGKDHLDRLTAPQLMSVIAGSVLNEIWQPETMTYEMPAAMYKLPKLAEAAKLELATKLRQSPDSALFRQAFGQVMVATRKISEMLSASNTGSDTSQVARKLLDLPAEKMGDDNVVQKIVEDAHKFEQLKTDALAAQEDDSWVVPKTMRDGAVGGSNINPVTGQPYDLFQHQKQAVNWAMTAKRGILADDAGLGKALPLDALVLTPQGYRRMGSISVGDFVIGKNGKPTKVTGVYPQGLRPVYRLDFTDKTYVECDDEHLWTLQEGSGAKNKWVTLPLSAIRDYYKHENGRLKYALPLVDPVEFAPPAELELDPYVLGLLLGDGSMINPYLQFHKAHELDLLQALRNRFGEDVTSIPSCKSTAGFVGETGTYLRQVLARYNLLGCDSLHKFVPRDYLFASAKDRIELLRGLCDTDGSVSAPGVVEYSTSSSKLAKNVAFLARSLGAMVQKTSRFTHYTHNGERLRGARSWRITIRFQNDVVPVSSEKHLAKYKPSERHTKDRRIEEITYVGEKPTQCIRVDAEDHLFVTNYFTVTHNTLEVVALSETLKEQKKIKRSILFLPPSLLAQWQKEIMSFAPAMGEAGRILNLSGLSMEARKTALQGEMAKNAEYILMSTGSLSYGRGKGEDDEGMDDALVDTLSKLDGMVIIDEAHQGGFKTGPTTVKGETVPGTVRHEIAKRIIGDRDYSFLATATPVPKEPVDLFQLINLVNPGSVGELAEWEGKLHGTYYNEDLQQWKVDKPENIVEINKRIKPFVLHRLNTDPKIEADMKNSLTKLQYKKKNEATGEMETHEGTQAVDLQPSPEKCKVTGLSQLDYLRPGGVCDVYAQKELEKIIEKRKEQGKETEPGTEMLIKASLLRNLHRLASISPELIDPRYTGPSPKIEWIANNVIDHFSGGSGQDGRPIVCFSSLPGKAFPVLQRALAKQGIDPSGIGQITGANSSEERAFQQDMLNGYERKHPETGAKEFVPGKLKVLLVGTEAGGAGLNLQKAANRAIFLDNPPTPGRKRQAMGRVWRTGQKLPVQIDNLGMLGTLDTSIEQRMGQRQMMATALLGEPNEHAFSQAAESAIKALSGRGLAADKAGGLSSDQMTALLKNAGDLDLGSLFQDDEDFDEADLDDAPKVAAKLKTMKFEKPEVNPEARDKLKEKAPKLAEKVNMEDESNKWHHEMMRQTAKSRHDVFMTQSKVAEQKGDHDAAARSVKAAEKIKMLFPDAFEKTTKTAAEKAGKKSDSAWDKKLKDEDKQIKDEAAKLNGGDSVTKGKDPLAKITSHKAAQHIVDNHRHFDPDVVKRAKNLLGGLWDHEKEVMRLHGEEKWLSETGHNKEASAKARERDKYITENLPKDYAEATGKRGERVLSGNDVWAKKPEGFVPPKKPEPVKAAPAKPKEPQVKLLHPKNPFHKKDDNVAHAAYEHLKEAAPKTDKELDAALLEYVKDRYNGKPAAMLQTAKELKRYLQDEKAVQLA